MINVWQWTMDWRRDKNESTVFGEAVNGRKFIPGMYEATINLSGDIDDTAIFDGAVYIPEGTDVTYILTDSVAGTRYTGSAVVESWNVTINRRTGLNGYTATLTSSGDITTAIEPAV